LQDTLR